MLRGLLVVFALWGFAGNAWSQELPAVPETAQACPEPTMPPLKNPFDDGKKNKHGLTGGFVNVVVEIDTCGRVLDAVVERTSLQPVLDEAAIKAALGYVLTPEKLPEFSGKKTALVRIPFDFDGFQGGLAYVPYHRCEANPDGGGSSLPLNAAQDLMDVYAPDQCAFPFKTVAEARAHAESNSKYTGTFPNGVRIYRVLEADGGVPAMIWYFFTPEGEQYPAVMRERRASYQKGSCAFFQPCEFYSYSMYSYLCEASPEGCSAFSEAVHKSTARPRRSDINSKPKPDDKKK